jgi:hypothetical protein
MGAVWVCGAMQERGRPPSPLRCFSPVVQLADGNVILPASLCLLTQVRTAELSVHVTREALRLGAGLRFGARAAIDVDARTVTSPLDARHLIPSAVRRDPLANDLSWVAIQRTRRPASGGVHAGGAGARCTRSATE